MSVELIRNKAPEGEKRIEDHFSEEMRIPASDIDGLEDNIDVAGQSHRLEPERSRKGAVNGCKRAEGSGSAKEVGFSSTATLDQRKCPGIRASIIVPCLYLSIDAYVEDEGQKKTETLRYLRAGPFSGSARYIWQFYTMQRQVHTNLQCTF